MEKLITGVAYLDPKLKTSLRVGLNNMPDNNHVLKLTGKVELLQPLKLCHNFHVTIDGSITSITEADNQDGTSTYYYKFEPVLVEAIDEKGERIKAKDARRKGQLLRGVLWKFWKDSNENCDPEVYYEKKMDTLIQKIMEGTIIL